VAPDCAVPRDRLVDALRAENIMARRYFWPGCHNMEPYRSLFPHAGLVLPATDAVAGSVILVPTGQTMDAATIGMVAQVIRTVVQGLA
jgi:dTDP-4-amino-4,6-dideoxygalactose transaminase